MTDIDRFDQFEDFGEPRAPGHRSVKKSDPQPPKERGQISRTELITSLHHDLSALQGELRTLDEALQSPRLTLYTDWLEKSETQGYPLIQGNFDHRSKNDTSFHTISGIGVHINDKDRTNINQRDSDVYEKLDTHLKSWKQLRKIEGSQFDRQSILHEIFSPVYQNRIQLSKFQIDQTSLTPNRYLKGTWVSDHLGSYKQLELKAFNFLLHRRVGFLNHLHSEYQPQNILYVGCGRDQIPAMIFGKENMTNVSQQGDHYFQWHEGEKNIEIDAIDLSTLGEKYDLIYFHDTDISLIERSAKSFSQILSPGGIVTFDIEGATKSDWEDKLHPVITEVTKDFRQIDIPSSFGDIMEPNLSEEIGNSITASDDRHAINLQQCFRIVTNQTED